MPTGEDAATAPGAWVGSFALQSNPEEEAVRRNFRLLRATVAALGGVPPLVRHRDFVDGRCGDERLTATFVACLFQRLREVRAERRAAVMIQRRSGCAVVWGLRQTTLYKPAHNRSLPEAFSLHSGQWGSTATGNRGRGSGRHCSKFPANPKPHGRAMAFANHRSFLFRRQLSCLEVFVFLCKGLRVG